MFLISRTDRSRTEKLRDAWKSQKAKMVITDWWFSPAAARAGTYRTFSNTAQRLWSRRKALRLTICTHRVKMSSRTG